MPASETQEFQNRKIQKGEANDIKAKCIVDKHLHLKLIHRKFPRLQAQQQDNKR